jgi:hypothetical protein
VSRLGWFRDGNGLNWPRVLLVALACTLAVSLGVVSATSTTAFGPYNPAWDGASDLREQVDGDAGIGSEFVTDTDRYLSVDPEQTIAFVIAPDDTYGSAESAQVRQFVANGGTLVVLENFGTSGEALLADIGAEARLDGDLLRDERNNFEAPLLPIATGVTNHTLTEGVDQVTLNYATAVQPGNATVLVRTSDFAYLVEDEEEELDDDDELGAYPVATVEAVGEGRVVTVGDPSITINAMLDQPDNAAFLRGLYERSELVLFDISNTEGLPPLTDALLTLRSSSLLQAGLGLAGIAGFALLSGFRLWPRIRRSLSGMRSGRLSLWTGPRADLAPPMSDEQRAAYLRRQHPDWDEDRIERVITALNRPELKGDDDTDE